LLERIGHEARALRDAQRLTQRELAARSKLSPRYLAELEAGRANLSVEKLADLAAALGVPLHRFIAEPEARTGVIALIGLRGAGKSTIGARLAARLGRRFVELDQRIEQAAGLSLAQIFELHGEAYYRRLEREVLSALLTQGNDVVVATGGSIVNDRDTWRMLLRRAHTAWLRARPEDHFRRVVAQGDKRPMARHPHAMAELRALLTAREPRYAEAAVIVDTSMSSITDSVDLLAARFKA
jgi:XRE family aerobic/anaerobic benzoate catabolism transcriptional regulator